MKKWALPKMAISLALAVLAAFALISITEVSYRQSRAAMLQVDDAQNTRSAIDKLLEQMLDAETGQRGYLLTGETGYLDAATPRFDLGL